MYSPYQFYYLFIHYPLITGYFVYTLGIYGYNRISFTKKFSALYATN